MYHLLPKGDMCVDSNSDGAMSRAYSSIYLGTNRGRLRVSRDPREGFIYQGTQEKDLVSRLVIGLGGPGGVSITIRTIRGPNKGRLRISGDPRGGFVYQGTQEKDLVSRLVTGLGGPGGCQSQYAQ